VGEVQEDATMGDDVADNALYQEVRTRRDGTGETRHTLSWIWTTDSQAPDADDENDDILRVEWAKSQAQAARCREEVLLLRKEMRRVIAFLDWKTTWWVDRQEARTDVTSSDLREGLQAYAEVQADLQKMLKESFQAIWKLPLDSTTVLNDNAKGDYDDDDDNEGEDDTGDDDDENGGVEAIEEVPVDEDLNI